MAEPPLLVALIFAAAVLYSSVGHAGASGYLAAMALVGVAPEKMKPAALLLNIIVATIASIRFSAAGCFSWRTLWPFALGSVPLAFLGGVVALSWEVFRLLVALILLVAAARMVLLRRSSWPATTSGPPLLAAIPCGAGIGLLAGLTGTGGGIFLSPLVLLMRWSDPRTTAGVSAAFILLNSIAGLAGHLVTFAKLPTSIAWWAAAAAVGGVIGSELGSRRIAPRNLQLLLAVVLVIAALKLALT